MSSQTKNLTFIITVEAPANLSVLFARREIKTLVNEQRPYLDDMPITLKSIESVKEKNFRQRRLDN